jgi:hypothetical protein
VSDEHNTHLTDADDETLSSPAESTSQAHKQRLKDKIITVNTYFVFNILHKLVAQLKPHNKFFRVHSQHSVETSFIKREEIAQQLHSKQVSL